MCALETFVPTSKIASMLLSNLPAESSDDILCLFARLMINAFLSFFGKNQPSDH